MRITLEMILPEDECVFFKEKHVVPEQKTPQELKEFGRKKTNRHSETVFNRQKPRWGCS